WQIFFANIAIFLLIGIPLIMMVYGGIKLLIGIKTKNKFIGIGAGILWFTGLILSILLGIRLVSQFEEEATSKTTVAFTQPKCDTLFIRAREIKDWDENREYIHNNIASTNGKCCNICMSKKHFISTDSQNIYFGFPMVDIVRSKSDSVEIVLYYEANGKDRKEASRLAHNINYEIFQKDSLIEFMPYFSIPKDEKWRNQQVHVEVRLPKGKIVYLAKNMSAVLHDIQNETNTYDGDMVGKNWIMEDEELRCVDCEEVKENSFRKNKNEKIKVSTEGININTGEEKIKIDSEGVYIESSDGSVKISKDGIIKNTNPVK
ncbi:MAG: hypothetical protein AABZ32_01155, partial [Bacteroidota bacterium]